MSFIGQGYSKGSAGMDVQSCPFAFANEKNDFIRIANLTPCYTYHNDFFVLIISCYHQYRYGINSLNQSPYLSSYSSSAGSFIAFGISNYMALSEGDDQDGPQQKTLK